MKIPSATILGTLLAAATAMAAVDPGLLNLVMPEAKILSGVQVAQSQASPFGQYLLSQMQINDEGFQKFVAATGFDPRHDLNEILAATNGDHRALVVGQGVFQVDRILAAAAAEGAAVTNYRGIDIVTSPDKPGSTGSIAFLDASTAVMGDTDAVKAAIDRRIAGTSFSGSLADKAKEVSAVNDAWFATVTPLSDFLNGKVANPNLNGMTQGNLLQAVLQASGGVKFGSAGVTISGEAVTRSDKDAQSLVDVMKFLASLVQMNKDKDPLAAKAASLADAAKFTADGPVMHLTMSLPEQQIEQLFMPLGPKPRRTGVALR